MAALIAGGRHATISETLKLLPGMGPFLHFWGWPPSITCLAWCGSQVFGHVLLGAAAEVPVLAPTTLPRRFFARWMGPGEVFRNSYRPLVASPQHHLSLVNRVSLLSSASDLGQMFWARRLASPSMRTHKEQGTHFKRNGQFVEIDVFQGKGLVSTLFPAANNF